MLYVYYFSKLNKWFASPGTESEIGGSSSDEDNKEEHVDDWGDSLWSSNNPAYVINVGQGARSESVGSSCDEDSKEELTEDWGEALWSSNNSAAVVDIGQGARRKTGGRSSDDHKKEIVEDWGESLWSFNNHAAADVDIGQEASCLEANYSMVRMSCSA